MLIGEVARRSGVSARMLRHYESLGLVRPAGRTDAGYREYSPEDIRRVFHIESLRSLGLSLREVRSALEDPGFTPARLVDDLVRRTRERIAAETALLTRLGRIGAAEPAGWEDVLQTVALLQGLGAVGAVGADKRQRAALSSAEEAPMPVEALVEAVLGEPDPSVAGALRWALSRSGDSATALLARGLDAPDAEVRERAVRSLAELPTDTATARLRDALVHSDAAVRATAALALGTRGVVEAVPTLVDMVVGAVNDVEAADLLSALAAGPGAAGPGRTGPSASARVPRSGPAERIAGLLVDRLAPAAGAAVRCRIAQALAGIPGDTAGRALERLSRDEDRAVSLTARYVLTLRDGGGA